MKVFFYGNEIVSQPSYPLVESLEGIPELKQQMIELMNRQGLDGLSAPQVGQQLQMVVVRLRDGSILELVNPQITRMYGPESAAVEKCISFPPSGNSCMVSRIQVVHVLAGSASNIDDRHEYKFKGVDARVVQHELDHLDGTFFFDRAEVREKTTALHRYREWKKQWKAQRQRRKDMVTAVVRAIAKQAVPTDTPLEAGDLMCARCGQIMKAKPIMGPRSVETVVYRCQNEETGCNYEVMRKVPAININQAKGIKAEATK